MHPHPGMMGSEKCQLAPLTSACTCWTERDWHLRVRLTARSVRTPAGPADGIRRHAAHATTITKIQGQSWRVGQLKARVMHMHYFLSALTQARLWENFCTNTSAQNAKQTPPALDLNVRSVSEILVDFSVRLQPKMNKKTRLPGWRSHCGSSVCSQQVVLSKLPGFVTSSMLNLSGRRTHRGRMCI